MRFFHLSLIATLSVNIASMALTRVVAKSMCATPRRYVAAAYPAVSRTEPPPQNEHRLVEAGDLPILHGRPDPLDRHLRLRRLAARDRQRLVVLDPVAVEQG